MMTGPHLIIMTIITLIGFVGLFGLYRREEIPLVQGHGSGGTEDRIPIDPRAGERRARDKAPIDRTPLEHAGTQKLDPVLAVKQACLAMEDGARRRSIDLLRPYHVPMVHLPLERGPLVSLLKSILQNALEATSSGGAVICDVKQSEYRVHFVISDSSGCTPEREVVLEDTNWRKDGLGPSRLLAEALGGHLQMTDYPGEGVVIDLSFPRPDLSETGASKGGDIWPRMAGNDDALDPCPDPFGKPPARRNYRR